MSQGSVQSSQGSEESIQQWLAHMNEPTKISDGEMAGRGTAASQAVSFLSRGSACVDDPLWLDADGDGCNIYKYAIESGRMTRADACDGGAPDEALTAASAGRLRGAKAIADR